MRIHRFHGRSVHFANGLGLGFNWVHGNGDTTKTSAILAGYHPPWSLTWGWALYWERPQRPWRLPKVSRWAPAAGSGYGSLSIMLPLVGGLTLNWQPLMRRRGA